MRHLSHMVKELLSIPASHRLGQKSVSGYYQYDGRKPVEYEGALLLLQTPTAELGVSRRNGISNEEILRRLLYTMVNEGLCILDDGIAQRASDPDIVWPSRPREHEEVTA